MQTWFSADLHLDHAKICEYCNRPFVQWYMGLFPYPGINVDRMNRTMIINWNRIVAPEDMVFHLGDFCFGGTGKVLEWEMLMNGKIVHILGNHDLKNGTKGLIFGALKLGGLRVALMHQPPPPGMYLDSGFDLVLCGHVHQHWLYRVTDGVPVINVGTDAWNYQPVGIRSIMKLYGRIRKEYITRALGQEE